MKTLLLLIISFFFLTTNAVPFSSGNKIDKKSKRLMGKWELVKDSVSSTDMMFEFYKNGTVKSSISRNLRGAFFLIDKKLVTSFFDIKSRHIIVDTSTIEIDGDTLIQTSGRGADRKTFKMVRLTKTNDLHSIRGKWSSINFRGYKAIIEYYPNTSLITVSLILKSISGYYKIKNNSITIVSNGNPEVHMQYEFKGDLLILHNLDNSKEVKLRKVEKSQMTTE